MYIKIGATEYRNVRNVSFAPETDVAGTSLPVNTFSADVITADALPMQGQAELRDDLGQIWARYWISDLQPENPSTTRLTARSAGYLLSRRTMPAVMYNNETLLSVLTDALSGSGVQVWEIDEDLSQVRIKGFCPEQSARDRAMWAIFVAGGYVKDYNNTDIDIRPIDTTETLVPAERTFARPALREGDWVTSVRVRAYTFTSGEPAVTDQWVKAGNSVWIVNYQDYTLQNPNAPAGADPNEKSVERCMLINPDNVSAILTHLSKYYFDRLTVDVDVLNNREYEPGQRLSIYTREDQIVTGYCTRAAFSYGVQARSTLTLTAAELRETAKLSFSYEDERGRNLGSRELWLPVGYVYTLQHPYFDQLWGAERIVYRPLQETARGTVPSGGASFTVVCTPALVLSGGVLQVISVDSVAMEAGVVRIDE